MKIIIFSLAFLSVSCHPIYAQTPARQDTSQSIDTFIKTLDRHHDDWRDIIGTARTLHTQEDALWFQTENLRLTTLLMVLENDIAVWELMDDGKRLQAHFYFEGSRQCIETELAFCVIESRQYATIPHSGAYAAEAAQNKATYQKVQDWLANFRFRLTDGRTIKMQ